MHKRMEKDKLKKHNDFLINKKKKTCIKKNDCLFSLVFNNTSSSYLRLSKAAVLSAGALTCRMRRGPHRYLSVRSFAMIPVQRNNLVTIMAFLPPHSSLINKTYMHTYT